MVHNGNQRGLVARGDGLSERGFWVEKQPSMIVNLSTVIDGICVKKEK